MRPTKRTLAKYGLTTTQWLELWRACGGRCPFCLKPFAVNRRPCVDHRHKDGLIRGLICASCNNWLGFEHDDAERLARAAEYLQHPPALDVLGTMYVPNSSGAQ